MSTWERLVLSIPGHGISYEICNEHEIKKGWGLNLHCLLQRPLRSETGTTYHGALRIHELRDFLKFRFLPSCCSHRQCVDLDFCGYGEPYKKPIYTSELALMQLQRTCCHKKHQTVLRGSERVFQHGTWMTQPQTQRAGAYPWQLVREWAQVMSPMLAGANRDNLVLEQQCEHDLVAIQKTKNTGGQVQTPSQLYQLTQRCDRQMPGFLKTIVFGQHTAEEANRRRSQAQKISKFAEDQPITSCWDSVETA